MEFKWFMIAFASIMASISLAEMVKDWRAGDVQVACYQAKAEAIRQHVEFKESCN